MGQNNRVQTFLGFAKKSQNIIYGIDKIIIPKKKRYLIIFDKDLSDNSRRKIIDYAKESSICVIESHDKVADISSTAGCKVLAIKNKNMADQIINEYKNNTTSFGGIIIE